jgi:hypothetical protein
MMKKIPFRFNRKKEASTPAAPAAVPQAPPATDPPKKSVRFN